MSLPVLITITAATQPLWSVLLLGGRTMMQLLNSALLLLGGASALELNETAGPVVFPGAVPVFYQGLNGSKCYRCAAPP